MIPEVDSQKFRNIVDKDLFSPIRQKITQIDPLTKILLDTIETLIINFYVLKSRLEKGEESLDQIRNISQNIKAAKAFSITLNSYLKQITDLFDAAINKITKILDGAVATNNRNTAAKALSAQRILVEEREFLLTLQRGLTIIEVYSKKFSNERPNYHSAILEAANTNEVITQLTKLKAMIENLLVNKDNNVLKQVNLARSVVYYSQEIGSA